MYDMTLELTSQRPTNLKTEAHLNIVRIIGLISSHCSNTRAEEDEQQQQWQKEKARRYFSIKPDLFPWTNNLNGHVYIEPIQLNSLCGK